MKMITRTNAEPMTIRGDMHYPWRIYRSWWRNVKYSSHSFGLSRKWSSKEGYRRRASLEASDTEAYSGTKFYRTA